MELLEKIRKKQVRACVMGLGYVGLPLALEFVRAGLEVVGLDVNRDRVRTLGEGRSYLTEVSSESVSEALETHRLEFTTEQRVLGEVDTVNICVPTPLGKTGDPDLSFVRSALESIQEFGRRGQLYVLESTIYPGGTEEIVLPALSRGGIEGGRGFLPGFFARARGPGQRVLQREQHTEDHRRRDGKMRGLCLCPCMRGASSISCASARPGPRRW